MRAIGAAVILAFCAAASGQLKNPDERPAPEAPAMIDEDEEFVAPTEYVFNPIQAQYEMKVGDHYAKKGSHRAAVGRYIEATRWNPSFALAFWKLGRSREKLNQPAQALEAYRTFLGLESTGNRAKQVRRRIAELEKAIEELPPAKPGAETAAAAPAQTQ